MGTIAVVTPGASRPTRIPRKPVDLQEIKAIGQIPIRIYRSDWNGLSKVMYQPVPDVAADDPTSDMDTLWRISWPLKSPRPVWNGFMQEAHADGVYPGKSEVFFMPMIDMSSSDMTCIYSTLCFVSEQAFRYKVTPVITFDQPLYLKAQVIVSSAADSDSHLQSLILRLGNFHTQMSFLGCIGHLMGGTGLQEALELVYAENAVVHILNGKAYSRAVRAHLLMDAALGAILTSRAFDLPWILLHQQADNALLEYLWSSAKEDTTLPNENITFVLDGGSLLHKLPWQRGSTYNQLAEMYAEFVARKYKKATIVFDGYSTQQTTKAATHVRRHGTSVQVNFTGDMILQDTREKFLANPSNKQRFINLLSETLMKLGFQIHHAKDDADCLIVKTTLDVAASSTTVLIGEDTDLLVLLLYHVTDNLHGVYFMPSGRKAKLWDIKTTRAKIGTETCKRLLFAHAITGCDTTSRMMNIGKSLPVKLLRKSTLFQKIADVFMAASTHQEIEEAGEKAVVLLYGDQHNIDRTRNNIDRTRNNIDRTRNNIDQTNIDRTRNNIDRTRNNIDQTNIDRTRNNIDQTNIDRTRNNIDRTRNNIDRTRNKIDRTRNNIDRTRNNIDQTNIDRTRNNIDRTRNDIDRTRNKCFQGDVSFAFKGGECRSRDHQIRAQARESGLLSTPSRYLLPLLFPVFRQNDVLHFGYYRAAGLLASALKGGPS
ncbi:hypothetical protein ACOMHN_023563 [Nucella lapillus]